MAKSKRPEAVYIIHEAGEGNVTGKAYGSPAACVLAIRNTFPAVGLGEATVAVVDGEVMNPHGHGEVFVVTLPVEYL